MDRVKAGLSGIVELLRRSEFFSRLLPDDLYWLAARSGLYRYTDGQDVFRPGDQAERFFIVKDGGVSVFRMEDGGFRREMARFEPGDVVGDFDFAREAVLDAGATAHGPTELLAFPDFGRTMGNLASERPDVAARILLRSVAMISSRVRSTQLLISENAPWVRELRRQMYTDAATGLWSRAFLDEELPRQLARPASVILIKPDRFKELCDSWGHGAGDVAMERIAGLLKAQARRLPRAWAVRLRSNETAFVAGGVDREEAERVASELATGFAALSLDDLTGGPGFRLTASAALAVWPTDGENFKQLVEQGYGALMRAWRDGGNRLYGLAAALPDAQAAGSSGGRA
ncbi:MAG: GGDEF domain-containing protein [Spirochaetales bacterium]|nr:GGDEF domain-containing protein [Spirochaetales bacterium]MBP7264612.1 GGDEF domain-containing protein [Spirochaetia bacterium]